MHNKKKKTAEFLELLREGESVSMSARRIGVARRTLYKWRDADEGFAEAWHDAAEDGIDLLEDVALKRAIEGSDRLLMFLLKARRPEKYRDAMPSSRPRSDT